MRFISMHKADKQMEAGAPPSPELMAGMGPLLHEMQQAGVLLAGEGLRPSSMGVRLTFAAGHRTITPGPFVGSNELIAGYCMVRVPSIAEAIDWATRFADAVGDVEIDIRPVTEPWHLGMCPPPADNSTTRFLMTHKADKAFEAGVPPGAALVAEMAKLKADMARAGVLLSVEAFKPSAEGVRLNFAGGARTVIDGPFAESKELIAGFTILQVNSIAEAMDWTLPFARLVGDVQIEIRRLHDA
jgi:hypothetical protein